MIPESVRIPAVVLTVVLAAGTAPADGGDADGSGPRPVTRDPAEGQALAALARRIGGAVVYTRRGRIRKVVLGRWIPRDLGPGDFARWSPDGRKIAVYHKGSVYVMDADGANRRRVVARADRDDGCPIEFGADGRGVLFWRKKQGFLRVDIATGKVTDLHLPGGYSGEPCLSADGKRLAVRWGNDLYAVDLAKHRHRKYARGCSPGVSPDGKRLMNNLGDHRSLVVRNWDGEDRMKLSARTCRPDRKWDNHHWSNHNDYLAAQGEGRGEVYVFRISTNRGTRVTFEGGASYPDLWVAPPRTPETSPTPTTRPATTTGPAPGGKAP